MKEFDIELKGDKNSFQLVVLGDLHLGDPLCDMEAITETIEYARTNKNCYVILNGDLINNALKTSKSDTYKESMSIEEEQELLIKLLLPIKDKILVMASGNHENRTSLLAGINPLKAVAYSLGIKDKLVDNSYTLNIRFGKRNGSKNDKNCYMIFGIHGGNGSGRRVGSAANALQDMALVRPDMDLYIHSHTHTAVNYTDIIFLYNRNTKKTRELQRTFYNANAYLKYGGYAEQKGYKPVTRSSSVIIVNAIRKKGQMITLTSIVRI